MAVDGQILAMNFPDCSSPTPGRYVMPSQPDPLWMQLALSRQQQVLIGELFQLSEIKK